MELPHIVLWSIIAVPEKSNYFSTIHLSRDDEWSLLVVVNAATFGCSIKPAV
jgi:hypothetical protein